MSGETAVIPQVVTQATERWRPNRRGWSARVAVIAALIFGVAMVLISVPPFWADRIALAAIYAIIGLSLNVVMGYTGQVSLGHHAFVGLSAFISAYLVTNSGQTFWIGLIAAVLVGTLSAGLLGLVALRIRGLYLALITLTYGFAAVNSLFEIPALTNGGSGMPAPRPSGFVTDHRYMLLCMIFLGVALFIDWRLLRSKVGRGILAVKQSDAVAASYGINVTNYKVLAFMLSGALAGLAGSLFAHQSLNVVSNSFEFRISLLWVLMVVVGGLGNRTGVVIASMFFALFPFLVGLSEGFSEWLKTTTGSDPEVLSLVLGPLLALVTIIQYPGGIGQQISPITRWLRGQKFTLHPEGKVHHKRSVKNVFKRFLPKDPDEKSETPVEDSPTTELQRVGAGEET